jgi:(2Fe-2S) ferredoxin
MAKFERYLFVCVNRRPDGVPKGSCAARGSEAVYARLKALLKERGLAPARVRACSSSCLENCDSGPNVLLEPDHALYVRVTEADLPDIVDALERGAPLERLLGMEHPPIEGPIKGQSERK